MTLDELVGKLMGVKVTLSWSISEPELRAEIESYAESRERRLREAAEAVARCSAIHSANCEGARNIGLHCVCGLDAMKEKARAALASPPRPEPEEEEYDGGVILDARPEPVSADEINALLAKGRRLAASMNLRDLLVIPSEDLQRIVSACTREPGE